MLFLLSETGVSLEKVLDFLRTSANFQLPDVLLGATARRYAILLLHEEIEGHVKTPYNYLRIVMQYAKVNKCIALDDLSRFPKLEQFSKSDFG